MANELEKTIEELEAEVMAELEEANGADAPKKSAVPAETVGKAKSNPEDAPMQDTGAAVVSPSQGDAPAKKVAGAAKEVSGDPAQKSEGKPDAMDKAKEAGKNKSLAAGYEPEGDELIDEMKMGKPGMSSYDPSSRKPNEMKMGMPGMSQKDPSIKEMEKMKKDEIISAMYEKMKGKKKETLAAMFKGMNDAMMPEMGHEEEKENKEKSEAIEKRVKEIDVKEHVDALMNGEGDLSEEFKRKAATVFEAAVKSKVRDEVSRLEDEYKTELDESIQTTKTELTDKVDTYLNYVVEEWMKENELAIERGLKGEIAEDFISGLKQLFEDHYVDIPDEKYDVLEAQSEKITELEKKLNESMEKIVTLSSKTADLVREQVISESTSDLAETEIEKFKSLTDDVEFTNEESFREKLDTLKESYFPKSKPVETQTVDDVETGTAQDIDTTDSMKAYMTALGKYGNK